MRKVVVKLNLHDDKGKQKALKVVCSLQGIESISTDMKDQKLTVIGDMDPVDVVAKIRKHWPTADIVSVGPAKEEKKAEPKKEPEKPKTSNEELHKFWNNHYSSPYPAANYHVYNVEENPNACVIC